VANSSSKCREEEHVKLFILTALLATLSFPGVVPGQDSHGHMKGMDRPAKQHKIPSDSALKPAQGASIKILSPKHGQIIKGDAVPLEFKMSKGKIGEHAHAYVDGQMVGMFKSGKGTLNGIKPGQHTLELRVATSDHNTELDATDKVSFTTK
jgi:hypothetical protein